MSALAIAKSIWAENDGLERVTYLVKGVIWQVRKRLHHSFITKLPNGAKVHVRPVSAYSPLFYFRYHERKDLLFLSRHAKLADTFVDVGANVGLFSTFLFGDYGNFILFEPAPSSYAALQETLRINPEVRARAVNVGLGDTTGSLTFLDEGGCSSTSRFVGNPTPAEHPRIIKVLCDTLDNQLANEPGNFVLKIDVEGFEEKVFAGASRLLHLRQVRLVMFERLGRTNIDRLKAFLESFGYVIFYVREDSSISQTPADLARPLVNLFAAPAEVFERIKSGA